MAEILFVTGTDTGVGKTVVSAVLARRAREDGKVVRYVKPVQTGVSTGEAGGDADFVAAAACVEALELLRFTDALAPAVAAERAGRPIDFDELVRRTQACADGVDALLVEGAGGLLVPLTDDRTMADLACALGARLVVVARPGLGTLNHTALTIEAAVRRRLEVATVVLSDFPSRPGVTERTNLERLRALGPPVEVVGHLGDLSVDDGRLGSLRPAVA
jgi:dethiobiotin synthase